MTESAKAETSNLLLKEIPKDLHHAMRVSAVAEGMSLKDWVLKVVTTHMQENPPAAKVNLTWGKSQESTQPQPEGEEGKNETDQ